MDARWVSAVLPTPTPDGDSYYSYFKRKGVDVMQGVGHDLELNGVKVCRVRQYGDRFFGRANLGRPVPPGLGLANWEYEELEGVTTIEEALAYIVALWRMS